MSVYIPLMVVLLGLGLSQQVTIHNPPLVQLFQDEGSAQHHLSQELVRTKRQSGQELVRAQPHLVHEMSRPEFRETSRSRAEMDSNSSHLNPPPSVSRGEAGPHAAVDENLNVDDEMERMVHLVDPREVDRFRGYTDPTEQEKELFSGPGAADTSLEASGLYGRDMESRTRGEEGQEDMREDGRSQNGGNRGGEEEGGTFDTLERDHTSPDLDTLIGYSPSLLITRSQTPTEPPPAEGPQEHQASPVLEAAALEQEQWEAEDEEEDNSSGYGVHRSAIAPRRTSSTAPGGTAPPETETGTDFGMLGSFSKADEEEEEAADREDREEDTGLALEDTFTQNPSVAMAPSREVLQPGLEEEEKSEQEEDEFRGQTGVSVNYSSEEAEDKWREMDEERRIRHIIPHTTDPSTNFSWDWLAKTETLQARRSEVRGGGIPEVLLPDRNVDEMETQQVMCLDWSELAGKGYVILNMTQNFNCEEFRVDQGVRLLKIMEQLFASRMNSPEGSWVLYLSKPTHQQHQLLMNVVSENGVIATDDVLDMLGKIRTSLKKVGIQDYGAASSCQTRAGQTRSDYGKLFVVLVIIGSVCMVIITSGFIYICWQRRLPASKTTAGFRADELHFVENGCHDNPMLDMANGGQSELQEKKPSTNGLSGGEGGREQSTSWQVFVNQAATEAEEEEQDTHL